MGRARWSHRPRSPTLAGAALLDRQGRSSLKRSRSVTAKQPIA